jgi:hypothetical protein
MLGYWGNTCSTAAVRVAEKAWLPFWRAFSNPMESEDSKGLWRPQGGGLGHAAT